MNIFNIHLPNDITLELDADSLVYRIGGAVDMMGEGAHFAIRTLDIALNSIYENSGCKKCNIYLGTSENYRKSVATLKPYKGNRKNKDRPEFYDAIRARLVSEYAAKLVYGEEAEDAVGIAAYTYDDFTRFLIGGIDKDLNMIAGMHYNYVTRSMVFIDKYEALRAFYVQLVTGDMTDNIPGLYHRILATGNISKANAFKGSRYKSKLIAQLAQVSTELEMWDLSSGLYELWDTIISIKEAGQLLWIRRYPNGLWVPPTERDYDYLDLDTRIVPDSIYTKFDIS